MTSNKVLRRVEAPALSPAIQCKMDCFLWEGALYREIDLSRIINLAPKDLLAGPYVLRFNFPVTCTKAYFLEDEDLYLKFLAEGKAVRWLHELFDAWKQQLIAHGLPPQTSIIFWPFSEMGYWLDVFRVFPGARVIFNGGMGDLREEFGLQSQRFSQ